jgi:fibronectin type 3 domain-containing protein
MTSVSLPRAIITTLVASLGLLFVSTFAGVDAAADLLAGYSFDAGAGATVADVSGNGLNGTLVGPTWTVDSHYGNALAFNGSSDYVDLGSTAALQLGNSVTWSAWVKASANPADDGQILAKSDSNAGWQFKTSPDTGPHRFAIALSGPGNQWVQRNSNVIRELNTWYHVAAVFDGPTQTLDIYVNGVLDNGFLWGTIPTSLVNSGVNANIGRRIGQSGYHFAGVIDEVRVYNRALSATEIAGDMGAPVGAPDTQAPTAPSALSASAMSGSQINLTWSASTDNVGVAAYLIERCQGAGCSSFAEIATASSTSFNNTGLSAGTTYRYRVRARDAALNTSGYSNEASATTTAPDTQAPTAPGTPVPVVVSGGQIDLSWSASSDNVGVTSYLLERCQGAACSSFAQITTLGGTTFSDTGLSAATSYSYRVRATDAALNTSPYSGTASATTSAIPTGLVAAYAFGEGSGPTTTDASGSGNNGTLNGATWTTAGQYGNAIVFNGSTNYVDLGNASTLQLSGSATWSAWVKASANPADDGQIIAKSNSASGWQFKTSPDTGPHRFAIALSGPGNQWVQRNSTIIRQLNTWYHVAAVFNASARTLDVYVNGVLDNGVLDGTIPGSLSGSGVNANIGRRTGNTGYPFAGVIDEVRVYNRALSASEIAADMNTPVGGTAPGDTQAPTAPGTPSLTVVSSTQINLSWAASTDDVGVTGYLVERCAGAGCSNFVQVATPATNAFNDTTLSPSTNYTYRVRATDVVPNLSGYSATASASTPAAPDTQAPTAPGTPSLTVVSSTQINLSWAASTDNVAVTGYLVERCAGAGCSNFVQVATPATNSFNDTTLAPSTSYTYRVRATDAVPNLSAYSATASASTQAPPDTQAPTAPGTPSLTVVSSTQINLSWAASTDNVAVTGYLVERCAGAGCSNFAQVATPATNAFNDTTLSPSTSYTYRVRATDAVPNLSGYSATASASTQAPPDTQAPTAPGTPSLTVVSSTQINVSWAASTDNVAVTGYLVERCAGAGCSNFAQVATPATNAFNDTTLSPSTSYTYRVRATDAVPNLSAYSATASATTTASTTPSGLIAGYALSEGNGPTTADASSNGITGTLAGPAWTTAGQYGNALVFNGSSHYVDLGNPTVLNRTGSTTWSAWIRASANPADDGQIIAKSDSNAGWQFKTSPDTGAHRFALAMTGPGNNWVQRNSNIIRQLNTWYHVAAVFDAAARTLDIYVNGVLDNGILFGTVPASIANAGVNVNIGRRSGQSGYHFAGTIDEVRVYDHALSASEIAADMSSPLGPVAPDTQAPTAPGTPALTVAGNTQINLTWAAATDNVAVTGYLVERCQGAGCSSFAQVATPATTSFNDTTLSAGTSYSYRVRATDAATNLGAYSSVATATTTAPDTQAPTAPGTPSLTVISASQINLTWAASTDNVAVTGYLLERCAGVGCSSFTQIATPATSSFNDTTLSAGTSYSYRVRATDTVPNVSAYSGVASTTTTAPDTQAPTAPGTPLATAINSGQINVTWSAATDNVGVTSYLVERCQGAGCAAFAQFTTTSALSVSDTGLSSGTSYSYRVRAADAMSNVGPYSGVGSAQTLSVTTGLVAGFALNEGTGTSTADISPSGLTGTLAGPTWTTAGQYGNALSFNGSTHYVDLGNPAALQLTGSATWSAWMKAFANPADDGQLIAKSDSTSGWQLKTSPDTGPHAFAIALAGASNQWVQRNSNTVRQLNTWYHVAGVYNAPAQTLDIYVNGVLDNGFLWGTVPSSQVSAGVNVNIGRRSGGTGYHFNGIIDDVRVYNRALSAAEVQADMNTPLGVFEPDTEAPTAPGTPVAAGIGSTQVNLAWPASSDNVAVSGYQLERCQGVGCSTFSQIATPTTASFNDTGLSSSTSYSYRVRATDGAANLSPYSSELTVTTTVPSVAPPTFVREAHSATDGCCGLAFNNSTLTLNVTGENRLLIVAWHAEWDGGQLPVPTPPDPGAWSVTNNGVPGTVLLEANGYEGGEGNKRFRIYYWLNPPLGVNTIQVSNPNTGPNELTVVATLFNNVDQNVPIGDLALDASLTPRGSETETVNTTTTDLVLHVIADALYVTGTLGPGQTSIVRANDGQHQESGDASLWFSTKPGASPTTTVSSSGWASRVLSGVAIVLHGAIP